MPNLTRLTPKKKTSTLLDLVTATVKLFKGDIAMLKTKAQETGVPWQTQLRAIVHAALSGPKMHAYKFIIPPGKPRAISQEPYIEADDCIAVAAAKSQEEALALLKRIFTENGQDTRWLAVADVIELSLDSPCMVAASIH